MFIYKLWFINSFVTNYENKYTINEDCNYFL